MPRQPDDVRSPGGIVTKVFLGCRTKILRAADAFYARRRKGPHRFIQNRSPTFVAALKSDAASREVRRSTFARCLRLFDFRLLQHELIGFAVFYQISFCCRFWRRSPAANVRVWATIWTTRNTARLVRASPDGPADHAAWPPVRWRGPPGGPAVRASYGLAPNDAKNEEAASGRRPLEAR
jgi:hypothetical protein